MNKSLDEKKDEQIEKLKQGMVPIGVADINGRQLHQFEAVVCDGINCVIMWSLFNSDFTAMNSEGGWLDRGGMAKSEYVLFTEEEQWEEVEDVISRLHQTEAEAVTRLMTSHYNMEAMRNEAVLALQKISEESEDESTRSFATEKIEFLKNIIPNSNC